MRCGSRPPRRHALTPLGTANAAISWLMPGECPRWLWARQASRPPGYGNLSQTGIEEHRHTLAVRMLARLPALFAQAGAERRQARRARSSPSIPAWTARATARAFSRQSLLDHAPALAPLLSLPPAPAAVIRRERKPAVQPILQADGVNRFLLYAHKLAPQTDLVADRANPALRHPMPPAGPTSHYERTKQLHALMDAPGQKTGSGRACASRARTAVCCPAFLDQLERGAANYADTGKAIPSPARTASSRAP